MDTRFTLKPGIIKLKDQAISPYTITASIVIKDNKTFLSDHIRKIIEIIRKTKITEARIDKFSIPKSEIKKIDDDSYQYDMGVVEMLDEDWYWQFIGIDYSFKPEIIRKLNKQLDFSYINISSKNRSLTLNIRAESISPETIDFELIRYYKYHLDIIDRIDCVLEVYVDKKNFIKMSDGGYYTFLKVNDEKLKDRYHMICAFDDDNILKYQESRSRYCIADYTDDAHIYVTSEQPFSAIMYLVLCKIVN